MAAKRKSMSTVKQIIRLHLSGKGKKEIARIVGVSKNTVKSYLDILGNQPLGFEEQLKLDDPLLEELVNSPKKDIEDTRLQDLKSRFDFYEKELKRVGVTRYLLWQEYRLDQPSGYSYSQFCYHLQQHYDHKQTSMILKHHPGEKLFVDFTGKKMVYYDSATGEEKEAEILVGVLAYSQKAFLIAMESQQTADLIWGMNKMMRYFGGSPQAVVPDNMKTAVIKSNRYEPTLNRIFEDFANHYQTTLLPTRVVHPKDKALAEGFVKIAYNRIYAPLRNRVFRSLYELNIALAEQLEVHNNTPFQNKGFSRNQLFELQEKATLNQLPQESFMIKTYRQYTVQKNSHIVLNEDKHYYSVPYAYIGQKVDVIYTRKQVNIYHKMNLIAAHVRSTLKHQYTTVEDHLPSKYRDYKGRSPDYYRKRADTFGPEALEVINKVLGRKIYVEQNYKSCDGILRLAMKTPAEVFTNACKLAIDAECFNYKFIEKVIVNKTAENYQPKTDTTINPSHGNLRGKSFYQ